MEGCHSKMGVQLHAYSYRAQDFAPFSDERLIAPEKRLTKHLAHNYERVGVDGRPVVNTSTALAVNISFSLIQILQFDPTQQVITLVGWISLVRYITSL